jgi:hypothetical protein
MKAESKEGEIQMNEMKIHVKIKLSALWTAVMFCYIYGDIFRLFKHGEIQEMLEGRMWSLPVTQELLLGTSIVMAIPSVMVFLSLALKPSLNRWLNIVLGVTYTALVLYTMPGAWAFYIFLGIVEVALTVLIVWYAWSWPKQVET